MQGILHLRGCIHCLRPEYDLAFAYRLRLVYLAMNKPIFDRHFRQTEAGGGRHVIEYDVLGCTASSTRPDSRMSQLTAADFRTTRIHDLPDDVLAGTVFLILDLLAGCCAGLNTPATVGSRDKVSDASCVILAARSGRRRGRWEVVRF